MHASIGVLCTTTSQPSGVGDVLGDPKEDTVHGLHRLRQLSLTSLSVKDKHLLSCTQTQRTEAITASAEGQLRPKAVVQMALTASQLG